MSGGPMPIFLEVHHNNQPVRTVRFQQDVVKIGKHPLNHLHLDHPTVSRIHAYIEVSGERATIVDLGSGAGTHVNGSKVYKHTLSPGDSIHVGGVRLVYLTRVSAQSMGYTHRVAITSCTNWEVTPCH